VSGWQEEELPRTSKSVYAGEISIISTFSMEEGRGITGQRGVKRPSPAREVEKPAEQAGGGEVSESGDFLRKKSRKDEVGGTKIGDKVPSVKLPTDHPSSSRGKKKRWILLSNQEGRSTVIRFYRRGEDNLKKSEATEAAF